MRIVSLNFLILTMCATLHFSANAQVPLINVTSSEFSEALYETRQVNSGILVGVQGHSGGVKLVEPVITVSGIEAQDKIICITISHISGVYSGKAKIRNRSFDGSVSFKLPAKLIDQVSMNAKEYAILVQASEQDFCHARSDLLFASWGTTEPNGPAVLALSVSPTARTRVSLQTASRNSSCQGAEAYLESSSLTFQSFSRVCQIEFQQSCKGKTQLDIVVSESGRRVATPRRVFRRECPGPQPSR